MPCNSHRCCRRPTLTVSDADAGTGSPPLDYVLLASNDENAIEGAATVLRGAGVSAERHDLGLRLACRGVNWKGALGRLSDALSTSAQRQLRVALIPVAADVLSFQRALLLSRSLAAFVATPALCRAPAPSCDFASQPFGDVFKGESLE